VFSHLNRLFRHSVVYGLSETISRGTGFILMYLYVRVITKSEIGVRSAVYSISAILVLFYTLGLDNAFLRYFMDEEYRERKRAVFSTAIIFSLLAGITFLLITFTHSDIVSLLFTDSRQYIYIVQLLFVIMIFDIMSIYPSLVLRAENRFFYYSFISLVRFLLFIALNLLMVWYMKRGLKGIFEANLIVVIIVILLLLPVFRRYLTLSLSPEILRRMLFFGVPTIFTVLGIRVIDYSDRRLILRFLGESEAGYYAVVYNLGMVAIMVFVNSFRTAWQPFFLSLKTNSESKMVFSRTATYYMMFICFIFLAVFLFRNEILHVYDPDSPLTLAPLIPLIASSYVLYGLYIILLPGIFFKEQTYFLSLAAVAGAVLNVGLNLVFIPRYGITGAACTTILSYAVMMLILYCISRSIYSEVRYELGRIGVIAAVTAFPAGLSYFYTIDNQVVSFGVRAILMMIPPLYYLFSDFLDTEEKNHFRDLFFKLINVKK